jgi:endoglucanase
VVARLARILLAAAALSTLWAPSAAAKLHVKGNLLVDNHRVVQLLGVNRSGTEYMCADNPGVFFDGPNDQASIDAMKTWRINTVRVPVNESCWLGVGRVHNFARRYRRAIVKYVRLLRRNHLYVILEDHVTRPGRRVAIDLLPMATAEHTPDFWRSLAHRYRKASGVLFDLYNEPHGISWRCWVLGCRVSAGRSPRRHIRYPAYRAAGMKRLLRAVRSTGARNPVLLSGVRFGLSLGHWLRYKPRDPAKQLIASTHTYGPPGHPIAALCVGGCRDLLARIARRYPVIAGELGEYDCAHGYIDDFMAFADLHGISYLGWTWDAVAPGGWQCGSGPALIENYNGTPTAFGVGLRDHLLAG